MVALNLADMEAFLKRRLVEEERVQQEIQDAFRELNRSAMCAHTLPLVLGPSHTSVTAYRTTYTYIPHCTRTLTHT